MKTLFSTILILMSSGCTGNDDNYNDYRPCSSGWYYQVEKKITTGDSQGHGPAPGSLEWRSVIEYQLGIINSPEVPPLETEQWCIYIHEHFIKPAK